MLLHTFLQVQHFCVHNTNWDHSGAIKAVLGRWLSIAPKLHSWGRAEGAGLSQLVKLQREPAPASLARSALGPRASRLARRVGTRHSRRRRTQAGTCHLLCSGSPNQKGHPRGAIRRKCVSGQPPPWQAAHHPEPVPRGYLRRIRNGDSVFRCGLFFLGGVLKADPLWGLRIPMRPFLGGT